MSLGGSSVVRKGVVVGFILLGLLLPTAASAAVNDLYYPGSSEIIYSNYGGVLYVHARCHYTGLVTTSDARTSVEEVMQYVETSDEGSCWDLEQDMMGGLTWFYEGDSTNSYMAWTTRTVKTFAYGLDPNWNFWSAYSDEEPWTISY